MKRKTNKNPAPAPASVPAAPATHESAAKPKTLQELGRAILAVCDPVKAGGELLRADSESVKIRALETFAGWSFGAPAKPAAPAVPEKPALRIIWDLPAPPHERE